MSGERMSGERIAKRLARAGLCSRREAERWIADGRVAVDGEVLTTPAVVVDETSRIVVDGQPLPEPERARLWRYHKPSGLLTTHSDPEGRRTVFASLPDDMPRVISIGRLDLGSEGLLLLTNDGALARKLEMPSNGWIRRYRVRVHGQIEVERLAALERGIVVEGVSYGPIMALLDRQQGSNAWITLSLREGKNREVRRVMEHLGWPVSRLIRVAYGPFQLGALEPGQVEEVPAKILRDQLGREAVPPAPHGAAAARPAPPAAPAAETPRRKPPKPFRGLPDEAPASPRRGPGSGPGPGSGKSRAPRRRPA